MEGLRNGIWYEGNLKWIYLYSMRNNQKNIENRMMELRDGNDGMEDNGSMVKNREIV